MGEDMEESCIDEAGHKDSVWADNKTPDSPRAPQVENALHFGARSRETGRGERLTP